MFKITLISVFLAFALVCVSKAQSRDVPSLLREQDSVVLENPKLVHSYIDELRSNGSYDSIRVYSRLYRKIAENEQDKNAILDAIYFEGMGLSRTDKEAFRQAATKLIDLSIISDNKLYEARGLKYLSDYYRNKGVVDSSLYYLTEAEGVAKTAINFKTDSLLQTLVGQFRHNKATIYYRQQLFDETIELALDNQAYALSIGDKDLEMRTYQILTAAYSALVSYGEETGAEIETEVYFERSKEFARLFVHAANQTENNYIKGFAYATLANMHSMQNELDSALVYYQEAANYANIQNDYLQYSSRLNNIGNIYTQKGAYEIADLKYMEAYQAADIISNKVLLARVANNISFNSLQLRAYNKAKTYAKKSIEFAEATGRYGTVSQGYGNLSEIEEQLGNIDAALVAYKAHIQYRDSLLKAENLQRIDELQTKYESEKKQAEIEILQNQSALQAALIKSRNTQIVMVGLILLLIAISIYVLYQRRLKVQRKELHQINQRLLSVQMNPHFLFNALVSIQSFVLQNREVKDTSNFVAKFAKVTRMVLNFSREPFITLKQELELLNEFLRLQQIRTSHSFDYSFIIAEDIDLEAIQIPPMLAQPFIENAVEHGILPKQDERGKIEIEILKEQDILIIRMRDNGEGFEQEDVLTNKKSLAIKITGERFELLRKITGKPFTFTITNSLTKVEKAGVEVKFSVPIM